jgi:hypothetical protein
MVLVGRCAAVFPIPGFGNKPAAALAVDRGLGIEGVGAGGWGGFVDLAGLDAGVDEEAYADAEGDEGAGGSAEDVTLPEDAGEGDEKEGDADGGAEKDDAREADVGAAADQADGGTALAGGDLGCGGRKDEALGDGGEALLAFELALAGVGPAADGDDAEDHDEACYGNDEGAIEGFADAVIENHERLLAAASGRQLAFCGASTEGVGESFRCGGETFGG